MWYVLWFLSGWAAGLVGEWVLHWAMHRYTLRFHIHHHHEFFELPDRDVALNTIDTSMNIRYFLWALLLLSPLFYFIGFAPVALVWTGMFWHLTIVYEVCHALLHWDERLPRGIRGWRLYRWWKGCHFEHHRHAPLGNYCVTFPLLDMVLGTYVAPRPAPARAPSMESARQVTEEPAA